MSDEIHADDRVSRGQRGHQWIPRTGRPREAVYEKDRGPALLCALEGGVQGGGYVVGSCAFDRLHLPSISHGNRRVWRKTDTIVDLSMGGVETAGCPDIVATEASSSIRRWSCHDLRWPLYTLDTGGHVFVPRGSPELVDPGGRSEFVEGDADDGVAVLGRVGDAHSVR